MRQQYLVDRAAPADLIAVERMCGLHAQVLSSVELALWARIEGLTRDAVQDALWQQRTLVKLWAMRGTLHVLSAADLGLWFAGMRSRVDTSTRITDSQLELAEFVGQALHGQLLSRTELAAAIGRLSGSPAMAEMVQGSWGGSLKPASYLGKLCFGPSNGQRVTFTNPASWIPSRYEHIEGNALAIIAGRYLRAYGPASPTEIAAWWGTTRARARQLLAALADAATEISVDGEPYWMMTDDIKELDSTVRTNVVRLLPGFDQWVVCACRRVGPPSRPGPGEPALDPIYRTRIYRLQGWVSPVLLVNGRIAGVWKYERRGRQIHVGIERFGPLPRWTRHPIETEAERLAGFLGGALKLTLTSGLG